MSSTNSWNPQLVQYPGHAFYPTQVVVPQRPYAANIQRNHTQSIGVVEFWVDGQQGINLADAHARSFSGLAGADDRLLEGFGTKVTYRLEWPGYMSFNKQKHALRATREKQSITRAKMATQVAEVMKDFIEEMSGAASSSHADMTWRVGPGYIDFADLYLLEIHQVAKASLQPVLAYRPRFAQQVHRSPQAHVAAPPPAAHYRSYGAPTVGAWP